MNQLLGRMVVMDKKENNYSVKIQVSKNGPYVIIGKVTITEQIIVCDPDGTSFEWRQGKQYPMQERVALCRCGQSGNKPFCDGTHVQVSFKGSETAGNETYLDAPKEFEGPVLKLLDIEELCASARFCHRAGGIWKIVPEASQPDSKRTAIEEACDCPSGRLVLFDKEKQEQVEPETSKSIGLIDDPWIGVKGPIWVRGYVPIVSSQGKLYAIRNRVTLCRCGKSSNKPFCDSSHYPEAENVERVHNESAGSN